MPGLQDNGGSGLLPRLLNDLGATRMVIENIETPLPSAMPALLPGAAVICRKPAMTKTDGVTARQVTAPSGAVSQPSQANLALVVPAQASVTAVAAEESSDPVNLRSNDDQAARKGTGDPLQVATGKTSGAPPAAFDSSAAMARSLDARPETPQVRFYDLDSKLEQLKTNPGQKIRIQLSPANLGKMDLTIASHRGMVTVTLTLDSGQAKEAVQRSLPILESRLAASGIRVDNFQVNAAPSSKGTQFFQIHQPFQQSGSAGYGYQRDRDDRQQAYQQPSKQSFGSPDFTFSAAMVNCLA
jgi:flagellar hook-length control protein FliK